MKKIVVSLMLSGMVAFAGEPNVISISDLKEATYKLILDVSSLKAQYSNDSDMLEKRADEISETISKISDLNENDIKALYAEVESLKNLAVFIKEGDDALDKYIAQYVQENKHLLP